jgi:hypothetical protein
MELRKSKRIYAAGTTDEYMNVIIIEHKFYSFFNSQKRIKIWTTLSYLKK